MELKMQLTALRNAVVNAKGITTQLLTDNAESSAKAARMKAEVDSARLEMKQAEVVSTLISLFKTLMMFQREVCYMVHMSKAGDSMNGEFEEAVDIWFIEERIPGIIGSY